MTQQLKSNSDVFRGVKIKVTFLYRLKSVRLIYLQSKKMDIYVCILKTKVSYLHVDKKVTF